MFLLFIFIFVYLLKEYCMRNLTRRYPTIATALALAVGVLALVHFVQAAPAPLLPPAETGDLFVLDSASGSVLRIDSNTQDVSTPITSDTIQFATGVSDTDVNFAENGIVAETDGTVSFAENASNSILRGSPDGVVALLVSEESISMTTQAATADPDGLALDAQGFLYFNDDAAEAIVSVNPAGAISLYAETIRFTALNDVTSIDLSSAIVADEDRTIYTASSSMGDPANAIYSVMSDTISIDVSLLTSGDPFSDTNGFMTRAPNGDLIIADNTTDTNEGAIYRVTPEGSVSVFLSSAQLQAVTGGTVEARGGIAFDEAGNFYLADTASGSILRFDESLAGEVWVSASDIQAITGVAPTLDGGIAFQSLNAVYLPVVRN
jgi:sugar lactone lactonase YvrE